MKVKARAIIERGERNQGRPNIEFVNGFAIDKTTTHLKLIWDGEECRNTQGEWFARDSKCVKSFLTE